MSMQTLQSSGELSSSAAVRARPAEFWGIVLIPGSATSSVVIYDDPAAAQGNILGEISAAAANSASVSLILNVPAEALKGVYCSISGTGAKAIVYSALI